MPECTEFKDRLLHSGECFQKFLITKSRIMTKLSYRTDNTLNRPKPCFLFVCHDKLNVFGCVIKGQDVVQVLSHSLSYLLRFLRLVYTLWIIWMKNKKGFYHIQFIDTMRYKPVSKHA
jgi:hypothetical protein